MEFFPYSEMRPLQREVYLATYEGLQGGRAVVINAPTGVGKTAAVLAAALKFAQEVGLRIHYAVRTRSELGPPVRELQRLARRGAAVDFTVLTSKQAMCCYSSLRRIGYQEFLAECRALRLMRQCRYFPPATLDVQPGPPSTFAVAACALASCPHEVAKERARWVKVVVSTYYYVFTTERAPLKDAVLIVDEAHSLYDSVAALNSARITATQLKAAAKEARDLGREADAQALAKLAAYVRRAPPGPVNAEDILAILGEADIDGAVEEAIRRRTSYGWSPYTPLIAVKGIRDTMSSVVRHWVEVGAEDGEKALVAWPMDPASVVRSAAAEAARTVYMSGTLPVRLFAESMGIGEYSQVDIPLTRFVSLGNFRALVDLGVTTRYVERGEEMYLAMAGRLAALIRAVPGGVLALFPSYVVMRAVRRHLKLAIPHWYEEPGLELDVEGLPDRFFIGAVAGGRLAEGVEYTRGGKNLLSAVALVGMPYPEPSPWLDRRVELLRPRLGEGAWKAVYLYQAIVRIRQAVGRLFRSPEDRGVLAFLDRRYAEPEVANELADLLSGARAVNSEAELERAVAEFFTGA